MLTIRFARVGKRNKAQYKIMLQEKTAAPGGRHVEILGAYDPHSKVATLKDERIKYWISKGAQPSDTAFNLFVSKGIISGGKKEVKIPAKKIEEKPEEVIKEGTGVGAEVEVKPEEVKKEEVKEDTKKEEIKAEIKTEEKPVEVSIETSAEASKEKAK